jgi:UDP-N-acetylmuramoylalanine--D-glutamate ligase
MEFLKDATVLVLGLGESGLAMARWCAGAGATVRVWDSREQPPHEATLAEHVPNVQWQRGPLGDEAFAGVQLVLKSPGLSPSDERIAAPLARAVASGIPVQGELDLFARALADLKAERGYAPKVLAVTGTNGKTTTTALTAMLIERAGKRVAAAGNIGPTMLQTLADALVLEGDAAARAVAEAATGVEAVADERGEGEPGDEVVETSAETETGAEAEIETEAEAEAEGAVDAPTPTPTPIADDEPAPILPDPEPPGPVFEHLPEVWVLELSSFQLDGVKGFEPTAAAVLNITQDHLDWHGSMQAYAAAKARIFGAHALLVINRDDPAVEALIPAPTLVKGARGKPARSVEREVVRFGLDAPKRPGDFGLLDENGMAWLVRARELDETMKRPGRGAKAAALEPDELHIQRLMPADALRVRGRHNASNALAALALATSIDCPLAPMLHGLREYEGEPHRVQYIATHHGVDAFDDSKGTNVGATVAALNGLGADRAPGKIAVILGGDGKGQDFAPLAEPVRRQARVVATIGRDAEAIENALADTGVPLQRHATLEAATRWCFERAHSGDAVLLSPACASLDMFRNYAHRAEVFVREVHSLVADDGGVIA